MRPRATRPRAVTQARAGAGGSGFSLGSGLTRSRQGLEGSGSKASRPAGARTAHRHPRCRDRRCTCDRRATSPPEKTRLATLASVSPWLIRSSATRPARAGRFRRCCRRRTGSRRSLRRLVKRHQSRASKGLSLCKSLSRGPRRRNGRQPRPAGFRSTEGMDIRRALPERPGHWDPVIPSNCNQSKLERSGTSPEAIGTILPGGIASICGDERILCMRFVRDGKIRQSFVTS